MNQDILRTQLASLDRKLNLLLTEHKRVRQELAQTQSENNQLRENLKAQEDQIASFQNRIKISKIVDRIDTDGEDSTELKKKLDDYIKEIDKCIRYLSQ
jgi:chromosome segregation ATPase